ncbi:MAG: hypothetical protein SFV81_01805 [Pirellulaceae bacterium]|nr:hypothetical protein [Pirellulaceae bacterium]
MLLDWQTWCALAVVAIAFAILLRRLLGILYGKSQGGCGACPNKSAPPLMKTLPLVQIGVVKSSSSEHRG